MSAKAELLTCPVLDDHDAVAVEDWHVWACPDGLISLGWLDPSHPKGGMLFSRVVTRDHAQRMALAILAAVERSRELAPKAPPPPTTPEAP